MVSSLAWVPVFLFYPISLFLPSCRPHVLSGSKQRCSTYNVVTNDNLPPPSERGFVELRSVQERNVSAQLHQNVELRVEIEAYPPPRVRWTKDDATVNGDKVVVTTQEHETR